MVPDDVKALAEPVLAHRLLLDPEAEFAGVTVEQVITQILAEVAPPRSACVMSDLDDVGSTTRRSDLAPAAAPSSPADDGATVTRASLRADAGSPRPAARPGARSGARRPRRRWRGRGWDGRARHPAQAPHGARGRWGTPRTRTITLPRVQVPTALTETGARILVLTGSRIRPIAESTRPVWHPVVEVLRWVSPLGWTVLAVGLVSWWLTARYAWVELAMVAVACLVLVLACLALAVGRARVRIRVDVEPTRVTARRPRHRPHRGHQHLPPRTAAAAGRAAGR